MRLTKKVKIADGWPDNSYDSFVDQHFQEEKERGTKRKRKEQKDKAKKSEGRAIKERKVIKTKKKHMIERKILSKKTGRTQS